MSVRGHALVALLSLAALSASRAAPPAPAAVAQVSLLCEAVYLPARSAWQRAVRITFDRQRVRAIDIDGQPVHRFSVRGTTVLTALDNERIRIDTVTMGWSSDFRGMATAEGRCERLH